jgi:hypothetical protein
MSYFTYVPFVNQRHGLRVKGRERGPIAAESPGCFRCELQHTSISDIRINYTLQQQIIDNRIIEEKHFLIYLEQCKNTVLLCENIK